VGLVLIVLVTVFSYVTGTPSMTVVITLTVQLEQGGFVAVAVAGGEVT
jgi:hypothetical protein